MCGHYRYTIQLCHYVGHPISSDNISETIIKIKIPLPVTCGIRCGLLLYEIWSFFLSQPDLMLHKFVYITMRALVSDNQVFNEFSSGGRVS